MSSSDYIAASSPLTLGPMTSDLVRTFLQACASPNTRRAYAKAIDELDVFAEGRPITRPLLLDWRRAMQRKLATASVNLRLTAIRKLIREARRAHLVAGDTADELLDLQNLPQRGLRTGKWLTTEQCRQLLAVPDRRTPRGQRNYCVLAVLLGCALRRSELAALTVEHLQMRDDRWVIENLLGKGGRTRSVAVPAWVRDAIAGWMFPTTIRSGRIVRQITLDPAGLSEDSIMQIVRAAAEQIGVQDFSPHDLRRTCAKLCRKNGGELEQIQFMLGHASMVTTERYLGSAQNLSLAVNDTLHF